MRPAVGVASVPRALTKSAPNKVDGGALRQLLSARVAARQILPAGASVVSPGAAKPVVVLTKSRPQPAA